MMLEIDGGASNVTIAHNTFGVGSSCVTPLRIDGPAGPVVVRTNTFDGAGGLCSGGLNLDGLIFGTYRDGSTLTLEYNEFSNIPEDGTDNEESRPRARRRSSSATTSSTWRGGRVIPMAFN